MRHRLRLLGLALVAVVTAASGAAVGGETLPLAVRLRARALEPGDPVRVEVASDRAMRSVGGTFLGRDLAFVRNERGEGGRETWSAWTLVDLDAEAGSTAVEVHGVTLDGDMTAATLAVHVLAKQFPTEKLSVSSGYVTPPAEVETRLARERAVLREVYERRRPELAPGPFVAPVPGAATSVFGTRRLYNGQPRAPHPGLDLRAASGTPVAAAGPGTVALAHELYYSGNTVIVDHGGGLFTIYAHLDEILVRERDRVEAGARIGLSGATGRVTGPHLHWGAKIGDVPFDPSALLDPALFE